MLRSVARVMLVAGALLALPLGPARAANPCRAACTATRRACLGDVAPAFRAAKAACPTTKPDRRPCVRAARADAATARKACRDAARTCRAACGSGGGGGGSVVCGTTGDGASAVNAHRQAAGLPAVTARDDLSAAAAAHATYMVKADEITHVENPSSPYYTADGAAAGQQSDVAGFSDPQKAPHDVVDFLMAAPFHGVGFVDPRLQQTGFGIAHDTSGPVQTAGAVDVLSGLGALPGGVAYPVLYPADGGTMPLTSYPGHEFPDPLTSCPGFGAPTGAPLIVQLADTPSVTAHTLTRNGAAVEHCVFDGTTYANPDASAQQLGRAVLGGRNAVIIMPRARLQPGTYQASLTSGGRTVSWSFTVGCDHAVPAF